MKQVIQSFKTGELSVSDVPAPLPPASGVLVQTAASLVSAGTERMVVDFAEKNLLQKARSRPDLVRQTVDKARREGVLTTLDAVQNRLDQPMSLGYSSAGIVIEAGERIEGIKPGDRVACAGGGHAVHAEVVAVPRNLVVPLPDSVGFEAAAFTTLGAIALQGIRLAEVRLGEVVAVIGLGLLGQLTVQMLKAAGCVVVGMDIQPARAELARPYAHAVAVNGEDLALLCRQLSGGHGADAVLITADTKSNGPLETAGEAARDKGIVVAVGAVGMTVPRKVYYEKELDFRISRSYGPGRYDPQYEEKGLDYPYAYVRWTEGRNMQAFVGLLAEGKVDVQPLITHRFPIEEALRAYDVITGKTSEPFLGVVLTYPQEVNLERKVMLRSTETHAGRPSPHLDKVRLGVIGAGNYANATLLPAIKDLDNIELVSIASGGGLSARSSAVRFGFAYCTTDADALLGDPAVNTVAILTRHNQHARQVVSGLQAGKHVFVEKPLCLTHEELEEIVSTYRAAQSAPREGGRSISPSLTVGFNRRFAPFVRELKRHLRGVREPLMLHYRANVGYIPPDHWVQDPTQGGGRLLGEACHFIDLLVYLSGSAPSRITTRALPNSGRYSGDNLLITLEFADGSLGTVTYVANGDKGFGKEMLEVSGGGLSARLDDYRLLLVRHGETNLKREARLRQDKGHKAEWRALSSYLIGKGPVPIPFSSIVHSTQATLAAYRSFASGWPEAVETVETVNEMPTEAGA